MDVLFSCACKQVQGRIEQAELLKNNSFVCLCDDCQSYAHFLGTVKENLDENGGTHIVPVHPACLKFTQGEDNLSCVRLFENGMFRWYASCCRSPIANTVSPKMGYIGFAVQRMNSPDRDQVLGPLLARVMGKFGIRPLPAGTKKGGSFRLLIMAARYLFRMMTKGLKKPNPFFDPVTLEPMVKPFIISKKEREKLLKLSGPQPDYSVST